ncbi:hypothetical protein Gobs01_03245 [Geodermatophilus obscurus DSM 43160]|uniref:Uncharacterized protein n=1 Tax=Geodermatophilus obscurus (strain ATCC 25078 / DSM 43160 / JCM 3152 / CCUG 61914 / KCC A-0152 / KCTC 9177 / NBRC 13315 / NRRL B-3577 / G-20) TaxID=526225 RepID=D2S805_GEOOG|nr:hypothetical protein Gobs_5058 [Geodermatophilus obscurus DSM 43160]
MSGVLVVHGPWDPPESIMGSLPATRGHTPPEAATTP